ncbi:MAG TPA: hypothetical protein VG206_09945 [Terriglobia bacterium]|nr:hypothetical protein [Terriglobia bacterium]
MSRASRNGFEEALTAVLNTQAATQQTVAILMKQIASNETAIREELAAIHAVLLRHEEILQGLPEAIQRRIGFQPEHKP